MKLSILNIIQPLTYIINKSLETRIVPNKLKIAKLIPIFKSSKEDKFKSYQPINLLPFFSKDNFKQYFIQTNMFLVRNMPPFIQFFIF